MYRGPWGPCRGYMGLYGQCLEPRSLGSTTVAMCKMLIWKIFELITTTPFIEGGPGPDYTVVFDMIAACGPLPRILEYKMSQMDGFTNGPYSFSLCWPLITDWRYFRIEIHSNVDFKWRLTLYPGRRFECYAIYWVQCCRWIQNIEWALVTCCVTDGGWRVEWIQISLADVPAMSPPFHRFSSSIG